VVLRLRPLAFATFLVLAVTDWRLRRWRLYFFGAYNSYPEIYSLTTAKSLRFESFSAYEKSIFVCEIAVKGLRKKHCILLRYRVDGWLAIGSLWRVQPLATLFNLFNIGWQWQLGRALHTGRQANIPALPEAPCHHLPSKVADSRLQFCLRRASTLTLFYAVQWGSRES